jgi:hypothetical protein
MSACLMEVWLYIVSRDAEPTPLYASACTSMYIAFWLLFLVCSLLWLYHGLLGLVALHCVFDGRVLLFVYASLLPTTIFW